MRARVMVPAAARAVRLRAVRVTVARVTVPVAARVMRLRAVRLTVA
jgi:hypothetical protein